VREEDHVQSMVEEEIVAGVARAECFHTDNSASDGSGELEVNAHLAAIREGCLAEVLP